MTAWAIIRMCHFDPTFAKLDIGLQVIKMSNFIKRAFTINGNNPLLNAFTINGLIITCRRIARNSQLGNTKFRRNGNLPGNLVSRVLSPLPYTNPANYCVLPVFQDLFLSLASFYLISKFKKRVTKWDIYLLMGTV